jgi:Concanavalin A-like lectin/glucanases superfamily
MKNHKAFMKPLTVVFVISMVSIFAFSTGSVSALASGGKGQKSNIKHDQLIVSYYFSGGSILQELSKPSFNGSPDETADACTPNSGAIAYWPLEKAGRTSNPNKFRFEDTIGDNDGICTEPNCPTITPNGNINNAALFTASESDFINVPSATIFDWQNNDSFSIEVWIKTNQDCTGNKVFFGRYRSTGSNPGFGTWWLGCSPGGFTSFRLRDSDNVVREVIGTKLINDGRWHYLVGVRNGSQDQNTLYVDGLPDGALNAPAYSGNFVSDADITFGYYDNKYFFDGILDEVGIYNRALSATEIKDHFSSCSGPAKVYLPLVLKPNTK